jgi:hypothetical protein
MSGPLNIAGPESRWPPALTIIVVFLTVTVLHGHIRVLPVWVSYLAVAMVLASMAAVALTRGSALSLRLERAVIVPLAGLYVANTVLELADMIGLIALHPTARNPFSLLSSSVAIWAANVLMFSLLYWQIDRGGPLAIATARTVRPDWVFPQPAAPEDVPAGWRPLFVDYLFLGYNTATAFSPADAQPLTRRAKILMIVESVISLLTMVVVLSRAISVIPT